MAVSKLESLKKFGWNLTEDGLKTVSNGTDSTNLEKIRQQCLNQDLRDISSGSTDLTKGNFQNSENDIIVQILKVRNISAPKANEYSKTAPKMLKIQLTDGHNTYSAIEIVSTAITLDTKPGTKILLKLKYLRLANGQLLLTPQTIDILGGNVEQLVLKWEQTKSLAQQAKGRSGIGGPPKFIAFGEKIKQSVTNDRGFKSLQNKAKDNENENTEFNVQRNDAIAEATKAGTKKTFGGGTKQMVDSNVQKIMDKGFSEEQAIIALKHTRNNVDRAISNLKRREERSNSHDSDGREMIKDRRSMHNKGGTDTDIARPTETVSLFDFLETKIPEPTSSSKQSSSKPSESRFENKISSSFRKYEKDTQNHSATGSSGNRSQPWSNQNSNASDNTRSSHSHNKLPSNNNYQPSKEYRETSNRENRNDYRDKRDTRDYRVNNRDTRDYRDSRDFKDTRTGYKDQKNVRDTKQDKNVNVNSSCEYFANKKSTITTRENTYQNLQNNNSGTDKTKYNSSKSDYNSKSNATGFKQDYNNDNRQNYNSNPTNYNNTSKSRSNMSTNSSSTGVTAASSKYYDNDRNYRNSRTIVDSMEKITINEKQGQSKVSENAGKTDKNNGVAQVPHKVNQKYPQIAGFQNKETNEHAKNMMKSSNQPSQAQTNYQQSKQRPQTVPAQMVPQQSNVMKNKQQQQQLPPPFSRNATSVNQQLQKQSPANSQMHTMPPFVQHQNHPVIHSMQPPPQQIPVNAIVPQNSISSQPTMYHASIPNINYSTPIMMTNAQQQHGNVPVSVQFNGKIGDLCLAKYWEDKKYYNAKITGVSDSTYVILFTDYGNAEEVCKTDCIPIIQAPPPVTNYPPSNQPIHSGNYRIQSQTIPHNNYHRPPPQQQPSQVTQQNMPYKNHPNNVGIVNNGMR